MELKDQCMPPNEPNWYHNNLIGAILIYSTARLPTSNWSLHPRGHLRLLLGHSAISYHIPSLFSGNGTSLPAPPSANWALLSRG